MTNSDILKAVAAVIFMLGASLVFTGYSFTDIKEFFTRNLICPNCYHKSKCHKRKVKYPSLCGYTTCREIVSFTIRDRINGFKIANPKKEDIVECECTLTKADIKINQESDVNKHMFPFTGKK